MDKETIRQKCGELLLGKLREYDDMVKKKMWSVIERLLLVMVVEAIYGGTFIYLDYRLGAASPMADGMWPALSAVILIISIATAGYITCLFMELKLTHAPFFTTTSRLLTNELFFTQQSYAEKPMPLKPAVDGIAVHKYRAIILPHMPRLPFTDKLPRPTYSIPNIAHTENEWLKISEDLNALYWMSITDILCEYLERASKNKKPCLSLLGEGNPYLALYIEPIVKKCKGEPYGPIRNAFCDMLANGSKKQLDMLPADLQSDFEKYSKKMNCQLSSGIISKA